MMQIPKRIATLLTKICNRRIVWAHQSIGIQGKFWLALLFSPCQVAIYWLVFVNAVDCNTDDTFRLPVGVDPWTRVYRNHYLRLIFCNFGCEPSIFRERDLFFFTFKAMHATVPGISMGKYYFAAITQVLVGCFGVFVTFILIMKSNEVVDLLLNFTAMEFVAGLDNVAFSLAQQGFLWTRIQKTTKAVEYAKFMSSSNRRWLKHWPYVMVLTILVVWWHS